MKWPALDAGYVHLTSVENRSQAKMRAGAGGKPDLLLVYTARIQTFRQDHLIGTDQVRAGCIAESVLLEVRTGIVAHTARSAEGMAARKSPGGLNFSQTIAKAESDATGKALLKLADAVVAYLRDAGN